jgi:hypothetical protein
MPSQVSRGLQLGAAALALWCIAWTQPRAGETDTAALAVAMKGAGATLEQGLVSAAKSGRPISAKFEVDNGKLQLSAYVQSAGEFDEIKLNPESGASMATEKITDAADVKDAQEQSASMAKAKTTLQAAVQHAVAGKNGARAISVYPALQNGQAIATVTLLDGDSFSTIVEKLD